MIDNRGQLVIRVDLPKCPRQLIAVENIIGNHTIGGAHLFEHERYFLAVRSGRIMQVDHIT